MTLPAHVEPCFLSSNRPTPLFFTVSTRIMYKILSHSIDSVLRNEKSLPIITLVHSLRDQAENLLMRSIQGFSHK